MMKRILAVMTIIAVLAVLTGCRSAAPADQKDPAEAVASVSKEFLEANADNLPALMELDAETLQGLYGIEPEWVTAYVCQFPMMNVHATEFFIAHVADGHMDDVKAAVEARQASLEATWEMYLPAQYELVKKSETLVSGNYILYAVTEQMDSLKGIFEKNVK